MGSNFSKIKIGSTFTTSDGEVYKKTSELTYDDSVGMERYIDPFFDKKIGAAAKAVSKPDIDISARVITESEPKKTKKSKKAK